MFDYSRICTFTLKINKWGFKRSTVSKWSETKPLHKRLPPPRTIDRAYSMLLSVSVHGRCCCRLGAVRCDGGWSGDQLRLRLRDERPAGRQHTCYRRCLNYLEMCNRLPPPRHPHSCESAVWSKQSITVTYWDPLPPPHSTRQGRRDVCPSLYSLSTVGYHQRSISAGVRRLSIITTACWVNIT